jgi:hypothetical protein
MILDLNQQNQDIKVIGDKEASQSFKINKINLKALIEKM